MLPPWPSVLVMKLHKHLLNEEEHAGLASLPAGILMGGLPCSLNTYRNTPQLQREG